MSRETLEKASGIEIPGRRFVLKVILAYMLALVPLNWLVCRYVLGRREWAWAVVPVLSLAFAVGVERAAAYDVGLRLGVRRGRPARDPRRLPPRPPQPVRLALLDRPRQVRDLLSQRPDRPGPPAGHRPVAPRRGRRAVELPGRADPGPDRFQVQPRSLALFRAEQLATCRGPHALPEGEGPRRSSTRAAWTSATPGSSRSARHQDRRTRRSGGLARRDRRRGEGRRWGRSSDVEAKAPRGDRASSTPGRSSSCS